MARCLLSKQAQRNFRFVFASYSRIFLLALLLCPLLGAAQQKIEILNADTFVGRRDDDGQDVRQLIGNVRLLHDSTYITCDTAYQYPVANAVEALGRVFITAPGGETIQANRLFYDGKTKIAELYDNIVLTDDSVQLHTNRLTYHRVERYGFFQDRGRLTDPESILFSDEGFYYAGPRTALFRGNVFALSPGYQIIADSLGYEARGRVVQFIAPTYLFSDEAEEGYTEAGYYKSEIREMKLYGEPYMRDSSYSLHADTLYYQNSDSTGYADGDVRAYNQDSTLVLTGGYGKLIRPAGLTWLTEAPAMFQVLENDTLTMIADTLFSVNDSMGGDKKLLGHYNVRFASSAFQGKADSLAYDRVDSLLTLYEDPVLWADSNQLSGDTIRLWMKNKQADSLHVYQHVFVATQHTELYFDQIECKQLAAQIRDKELHYLHAEGNTQTIYFSTNSIGKLSQMTRAYSVAMDMWMEDNSPYRITLIKDVDGKAYPLHLMRDDVEYLPSFRWRPEDRPPLYLRPYPLWLWPRAQQAQPVAPVEEEQETGK